MFNNVQYCVLVLLCSRLCLYLEQTLEFRLKYFSMCRLLKTPTKPYQPKLRFIGKLKMATFTGVELCRIYKIAKYEGSFVVIKQFCCYGDD